VDCATGSLHRVLSDAIGNVAVQERASHGDGRGDTATVQPAALWLCDVILIRGKHSVGSDGGIVGGHSGVFTIQEQPTSECVCGLVTIPTSRAGDCDCVVVDGSSVELYATTKPGVTILVAIDVGHTTIRPHIIRRFSSREDAVVGEDTALELQPTPTVGAVHVDRAAHCLCVPIPIQYCVPIPINALGWTAVDDLQVDDANGDAHKVVRVDKAAQVL
jgi:hypothetical protein